MVARAHGPSNSDLVLERQRPLARVGDSRTGRLIPPLPIELGQAETCVVAANTRSQASEQCGLRIAWLGDSVPAAMTLPAVLFGGSAAKQHRLGMAAIASRY